jgi:nucleotide sugar dehydrogenase
MMIDKGYVATYDPDCFKSADVVVICVPTPLTEAGEPDLRYLELASENLKLVKSGCVVILESTSYPGTTEEILLPKLEFGGKKVDKDFYLAFSPERVDPGNKTFNIKNTPRLVGGVTALSSQLASDFYEKFVEKVIVLSGAREAEMAKIIENTFRLVNISLANELLQVANDLGVDYWESLRGASTKPFGFQAFAPGPGIGGHCIPVDPQYLVFQAGRLGAHSPTLVEAAFRVDKAMPERIASRALALLRSDNIDIKTAKVILVGITYKPNSKDTRESPGLKLMSLLQNSGVSVSFTDPFIDEISVNGSKFNSVFDYDDPMISDWDLVVLLQNHSDYDLGLLVNNSRHVLDTRGVLSGPNVSRV